MQNGITDWIHGWKQRGWTTADKKPVKNVDLWQRLEAWRHSTTQWRWVSGHAGDPGNERADALANRGVDRSRVLATPQCRGGLGVSAAGVCQGHDYSCVASHTGFMKIFTRVVVVGLR